MSDKPLLGRHDAVPRRRWRWLLPTLLVVAVLALGGSVVARVLDDDEAGAPKAALDSYLEALETNATIRAYGMLCSARPKPTQDEFEREIAAERRNFGGVVGHRLGDAKRLEGGDVVVTYTIQYRQTHRFYSARLRDERGEWKVCGFGQVADTGTTTTTK